MQNLAGDPRCDETIRHELTRCGITVVEGQRSRGEVAASVTGRLGAFTFRRAWYYYVAEGPMPLTEARKLYDDPVGRTDVRVSGHCRCPAPGDPGGWVTWRLPDGRTVVPVKDMKELQAAYAQGKFWVRQDPITEFVGSDDPESLGAIGTVDLYHVDSEIGLFKLAEVIRALPFAWESMR